MILISEVALFKNLSLFVEKDVRHDEQNTYQLELLAINTSNKIQFSSSGKRPFRQICIKSEPFLSTTPKALKPRCVRAVFGRFDVGGLGFPKMT